MYIFLYILRKVYNDQITNLYAIFRCDACELKEKEKIAAVEKQQQKQTEEAHITKEIICRYFFFNFSKEKQLSIYPFLGFLGSKRRKLQSIKINIFNSKNCFLFFLFLSVCVKRSIRDDEIELQITQIHTNNINVYSPLI